ncbi:hypothetical protein AK812_SmicGene37443 [Symbiodinium microadriaticum]|uniref:Uncharacterized protein n=1 Tax=Symbiodinium microadriaticum TaxID=2951 RepID=A0A1Q9CGA0_SYMMI|nr:hypothetical protein AK812_SmicGene37443 [Symbiodinium microadriaticum]CAE7909648.1 unnamed protein product [Symbiodinium microadriaticum]
MLPFAKTSIGMNARKSNFHILVNRMNSKIPVIDILVTRNLPSAYYDLVEYDKDGIGPLVKSAVTGNFFRILPEIFSLQVASTEWTPADSSIKHLAKQTAPPTYMIAEVIYGKTVQLGSHGSSGHLKEDAYTWTLSRAGNDRIRVCTFHLIMSPPSKRSAPLTMIVDCLHKSTSSPGMPTWRFTEQHPFLGAPEQLLALLGGCFHLDTGFLPYKAWLLPVGCGFLKEDLVGSDREKLKSCQEDTTLIRDQALTSAQRAKTLQKSQALILKFAATRQLTEEHQSETEAFVLELSFLPPGAEVIQHWYASAALAPPPLSVRFIRIQTGSPDSKEIQEVS